ncbi:hypothetical protein TcCL_Unassigned02316 [Trypanosoma cruzi]|nr:hypothetical protein TcCL_Unassigned02316 [Trypanosoma cruzi]
MPASAARVKLVFPTAARSAAETTALTPATTSASARNSSTQPVRKNQGGTQSLLQHIPRNHLQARCPPETPEQHNRKTVHCWQGSRTRRFHPATDDCASCVTRPQVRGAPTPKRWAFRPTTLPHHRSPRSATDHPLTEEKAQWSGHCIVRTTQQKLPQRTNALECPSEGASGLAVKPTDTGEPPALHASNDAIERSVTWHIKNPILVSVCAGMTVLPSSLVLTNYSTGSFDQIPPHCNMPPDK